MILCSTGGQSSGASPRAARTSCGWSIHLMATWSGTAFTAFVAADAYSWRIVGWRTAPSMAIELPLDALKMRRDPARAGQAVDGV